MLIRNPARAPWPPRKAPARHRDPAAARDADHAEVCTEVRHQIVQRIGADIGTEPGLQLVVRVVDFMFCGDIHQAFSGYERETECEWRNSAIGNSVIAAARPSATLVARAGSHCMASASNSAMAAVPRQKLS